MIKTISPDSLPHPNYRPDIDGLRAIAVLSVLGYHAFPDIFKGGFIGVDVFFVISGYLIGSIILSSLQKNVFSFREFYIRRIRRIFPALGLMLLTTLVAGIFLLPDARFAELGKYSFAGAAFLANFALWQDSGYFDAAAESKPLLHLWSLGIEEQFYIVWPMILFLFWRLCSSSSKHSRNRLLLALVSFFAFFSFAFNIAWVHKAPSTAFYLPWSRAWELLAGSLLAYAHLEQKNIPVRYRNSASWVGGFALLVGLIAIHKEHPFPGWRALLPVISTCLLIAAGPHATLNRKLLSNPVALWFGLLSYPLYLWHWPILSLAQIMAFETPPWPIRLALLLISLGLAFLTYHWVERPIRQHHSQQVGTSILIFTLACIGLVGASIKLTDGAPGRPVYHEAPLALLDYYENLHRNGLHHAYREECDFYDWKTRSAKSSVSQACLRSGVRGTVFLWGDSHAQALSLGLSEILPSGFVLAQIASSGCPPDFPDNSLPNPGCRTSNETALAEIAHLKPELVVLAQREHHESKDWLTLVAKLHHIGAKRVLVVGPLPQWLPSLPMVIARQKFDSPKPMLREGLAATPLASDMQLRQRNWAADGITYLSPIEALCQPDQGCLARLPLPGPYNLTAVDYGHLSPDGSRWLAQTLFRPKINALFPSLPR